MKRILLSLFILMDIMLPATLSAETMQYLVLTQADGTEVAKIALAEMPVITFSEGNLVITCGDKSITTRMDGLQTSFINEDSPTGISDITADKPQLPKIAFGQAVFSGLKAGERVAVYTLDGKMTGSIVADSDGCATVSLSTLGHGIFILRTPTRSFKIRN